MVPRGGNTMTRRGRFPGVRVLLAVGFVVASAAAAIDFCGSWNVDVTGGLLEPYVSHWVVSQTGTQLSVVVDGGSPVSGFIDPMTGAFTLSFPGPGDGCSGSSVRGTVS